MTLTAGQAFLAIEPDMILGTQQINYKAIDKFLKDNKVDTSKAYTLIFSPDLNSSNHIYYKVTVDGVMSLTGALQTNPSPPKDAE